MKRDARVCFIECFEVAPVFAPGRGLKLMRLRSLSRLTRVAPVFAPGRGLKPYDSIDVCGGGHVAPVFAPGRGLKLGRVEPGRRRAAVAPVFAPGRGLKPHQVNCTMQAAWSPRCSHRGAD